MRGCAGGTCPCEKVSVVMNGVEEERGPLFKGAGTPAWWPRGGAAGLGGQEGTAHAPGRAGGNSTCAVPTPSVPSGCSALVFKLHSDIVLIFKKKNKKNPNF